MCSNLFAVPANLYRRADLPLRIFELPDHPDFDELRLAGDYRPGLGIKLRLHCIPLSFGFPASNCQQRSGISDFSMQTCTASPGRPLDDPAGSHPRIRVLLGRVAGLDAHFKNKIHVPCPRLARSRIPADALTQHVQTNRLFK